jgi:hypothetical protein
MSTPRPRKTKRIENRRTGARQGARDGKTLASNYARCVTGHFAKAARVMQWKGKNTLTGQTARVARAASSKLNVKPY